MQKQAFSFAVGALLLSASAVSAATLTDNLNLRSGPGISFDVIGAMPAGSDVRVLNCGPSGCRIVWNDTTGFASRRFISSGGPIYAASSSTAVVALTIMGTDMPRPEVRPGRQIQTLVTAMRLRPLPWLSHPATTMGTATVRPGVLPGLRMQAWVIAMRLRPLPWLSHLATTTGTATPRPGVLPGRQIQASVTAAGAIAVTTDIADANIQAAPKTRLKIVST
jgi:hypothetical protein